MKTCPVCKETKSLNDFHKHSKRSDGRQSLCKVCKTKKDRAYHEKNREKVAARRAKPENVLARRAQKYGISVEQLQILTDESGGLCQICNKNEATCVDHCHETGRVRGLLCRWCNSALGYFKDSRESMQNAIDYLDAY